jgi:hypothetical protein
VQWTLAYVLDGDSNHPNRLLEKIWWVGTPFPYRYSAIVAPQFQWDLWGPELLAIDIGRNGWSEADSPTWKQLAAILGTAVPFWYRLLRDPDTIKAWRPGSPTAIVPAFDPELPTEPFTALAADEPDGSPVIPLCLWLARTIRDRWTDDAWEFFNQLREIPDDGAPRWTHAAFPLELQRPEAEPPKEETRRKGWWQILNRRDTLAARVALLGRKWSGHDDWPAGDVAKVRPNKCPTAAIWAARLDPAPKKSRTVLEQSLLTSVDPQYHRSELLQDPKTGLPAIYCENSSEGAYIATLSPHWLPTLDPLTSVISVTTTSGSPLKIRDFGSPPSGLAPG